MSFAMRLPSGAPPGGGAAAEVGLLAVWDLTMHFPTRSGLLRRAGGVVQAVDGISLTLGRGEALGLVGESGCGKTTTGRLVARLLEPTAGEIVFDGRDVAHLDEKHLRPFRRKVQVIFQDPYGSLNPRHTVGTIVGTALRIHDIVPRGRERARVQELLEVVGLDPQHVKRYPSEFSGGQRQRIGIARALAVRPLMIVADEPVSALDLSIQAQIVNLLEDLRRDLGIAFLFIAHDLGVVRQFCSRVSVMYLGRIVETGPREGIFGAPQHPYTQALLSAVPDLGSVRGTPPKERIRLAGDVPSPVNPPSGCRFRTRCWKARDLCAQVDPPLIERAPGQYVACHFAEPRAASVSAQAPASAGYSSSRSDTARAWIIGRGE